MSIKSFKSASDIDKILASVPKFHQSEFIRSSIRANSPLKYTEKKNKQLKKII